jgi:type VI secretion system protein ImpJ
MDLARRGAVQQLVAVLPYSEALLESGEQHPFQIYLALCSLAGHLASIATDPIPPSFSRYNHLDIAASFSEVLGYLRKIIQENSSENYTGIPFLHGDNAYYVMFEPSWKGRKLILAMRTGNIPRQDVVTWGEQAVIASSILQDSMRERRMLGARRVQIEREPGLFSGPEVVLFHLTNDNQFIQGGEMLEVGGGPSSRPVGEPVEMTLYVMQN